MQRKIKGCLTEIINDYQSNGRDFVNYKYDEYLGMDLLLGDSGYILSSNLWELMSAKYGLVYDEDGYEEFHCELYYVCKSMGLSVESITDEAPIPFYIIFSNELSFLLV